MEKEIEQECLKRLEMMGKQGNTNGGTCYFDANSLLRFSEVPTVEEVQRARRKVDEKMKEINAKPYMITLSATDFGDIMNVFYVFKDEDDEWKEDWKIDRANIENVQEYDQIRYHNMFGYAYNMTDPDLSDFGYMGLSENFDQRVF